MSQSSRQYELVLLGATGYTGKLTAEHIATYLPTNLNWAIAGRNAKKLQDVVDELTKKTPDRKQPAIEICELEKGVLDVLAKKARLIITTVGPYMLYGEQVLAACAKNGTHYLDCTGETPWYHDMVEKYHETSTKTGAIIIPECGLDSVPADMMTFALTNHIRKTLSTSTSSVVMSMYAFKSGTSGGTSSTALNLFSHYPLSKLSSTMKPYALSPVRPTKPSKPPSANLFYRLLGLRHIPELAGLQTNWPMATVDTAIVHRSWGLFESIAKDSSRPNLSYGPHFRFTEYMRTKNVVAGSLVHLIMVLGGFLLAFPLSRWILTPFIKKFLIPAPGEGPTKEEMKKEFLHYRGMGIADTQKKEKVMGKLEVPYGGYVATAVTLTAAAEVVLRGDLAATEAGKLGGGIVTPAMLGEQYLEKLREIGMNIEVGI
ncbi:hypothetical protein K469DRAFT_623203 [Zopfia rhizophila CBS 207.26]|uniref:Saccharopine dehydrogenase NADP binding domain-containing protein n=1 Tax=Zopfia rhizophila CBS 207.26 TaxID=1314779 RepID=A0A6A6EKD0_9PEZI|nr:hypothetical protein K469DRAFT_623203 [Zopfia rhizophila CBS 207.26]